MSVSIYELIKHKLPPDLKISDPIAFTVKGIAEPVMGRIIWIGNFKIEKDPTSPTFYKMTEAKNY